MVKTCGGASINQSVNAIIRRRWAIYNDVASLHVHDSSILVMQIWCIVLQYLWMLMRTPPPHPAWLSTCVVTFLVIRYVVMFSGFSCRIVFVIIWLTFKCYNYLQATRTLDRVTITSHACVHCCAMFLRSNHARVGIFALASQRQASSQWCMKQPMHFVVSSIVARFI